MVNSNLYRSYHHVHSGRRVYPGAADVDYKDVQYYDVALLLNGLDPAPRKQQMFSKSLAIKGKRGADLFTQNRFLRSSLRTTSLILGHIRKARSSQRASLVTTTCTR